MKTTQKGIKLIGLSIILVLVFLCAFNVTYSYFTAIKSIEGTLKFANFNVQFMYMSEGAPTYSSEDVLTIYPRENQIISRGDTFSFATSNDGNAKEITSVGFRTTGAAAYVRLWVNAYIVNDGVLDQTNNYGKYFQLVISFADTFEMQEKTADGVTNNIYFLKNRLNPNANTMFAQSMKLSEDAPIEILNQQIKITVTFEAVQADNEAFKSVFNDDWGYLESWS